jgi:polyisoprenoid-binding protein YceI
MRYAKFAGPWVLASILLAGAPAMAAAPPAAPAGQKLKIDLEHSSVRFSVRHLFTQVQGRFNRFGGELDWNEQAIETSKVAVTIQSASIDTNVAARDEDLRSPRFFDSRKFPAVTFTSTRVEKVAAKRFKVHGKLTMHGVAKDVVLDAEFLGAGKDPWGNQRYSFHATTTVSRKDFGIAWNEPLEGGGGLVGDEVAIAFDIEAMPG